MRRHTIRLWGKSALIGFVAGLLAALLIYFGMDRISAAGIEILREVFGWPLALAETLSAASQAPESPPPTKWNFTLLTWGSVAAHVTPLLMIGRPSTIERIWPEPPRILDYRLFDSAHDPDNPRYAGRSYCGRAEDVASLMRFAGPSDGEQPRWKALSGVHGVGKTRLALHWLQRLQHFGDWDAGILREDMSLRDIRRCRFRRKTAILIDEASRQPELWRKLDALIAGNRRRVRILLVDQLPPSGWQNEERPIRVTIEGAWSEPLRVKRLVQSALAEIAPGASQSLLADADGRPLYVLLGDDPADTVRRRVAERLRNANAGEPALLAFAALAGPVEHRRWQRHLAVRPNLDRLVRLFGGIDREILRTNLPALSPEPFANTLLLNWAADQTDQDRADLFDAAIAANPRAVMARLGSLWSSGWGIQDDERRNICRDLQSRFDVACPDLVAELRNDLRTILSPLADPNLTLVELENLLEQVDAYIAMRPDDREVQLLEAQVAVNVISHYGAAADWAALERWGARLEAVTQAERWRDDAEIQLCEAKAAVNAMCDYGAAADWVALERWGARLEAVTQAERWRDDAEIQLCEAKAAVNAIAHYGAAADWAALERWDARLLAVTHAERWRDDAEIQSCEARAAANAILCCGAAGRPMDVRLWRARLAAVAHAHPGNLAIQERAHQFGVSYVQQSDTGPPPSG